FVIFVKSVNLCFQFRRQVIKGRHFSTPTFVACPKQLPRSLAHTGWCTLARSAPTWGNTYRCDRPRQYRQTFDAKVNCATQGSVCALLLSPFLLRSPSSRRFLVRDPGGVTP